MMNAEDKTTEKEKQVETNKAISKRFEETAELFSAALSLLPQAAPAVEKAHDRLSQYPLRFEFFFVALTATLLSFAVQFPAHQGAAWIVPAQLGAWSLLVLSIFLGLGVLKLRTWESDIYSDALNLVNTIGLALGDTQSLQRIIRGMSRFLDLTSVPREERPDERLQEIKELVEQLAKEPKPDPLGLMKKKETRELFRRVEKHAKRARVAQKTRRWMTNTQLLFFGLGITILVAVKAAVLYA
jgi:hypothetical protein